LPIKKPYIALEIEIRTLPERRPSWRLFGLPLYFRFASRVLSLPAQLCFEPQWRSRWSSVFLKPITLRPLRALHG